MAKTHTFEVTGRGIFPYDMLRYDACWPAREQDSRQLHYNRDVRTVRLQGLNLPTEARWISFGWAVNLYARAR